MLEGAAGGEGSGRWAQCSIPVAPAMLYPQDFLAGHLFLHSKGTPTPSAHRHIVIKLWGWWPGCLWCLCQVAGDELAGAEPQPGWALGERCCGAGDKHKKENPRAKG